MKIPQTIPNVYERIPLTPLPTVIELDGDAGWIAWDSAVRELDPSKDKYPNNPYSENNNNGSRKEF